jgi:DNA modification methylase
MKYPDDYINQIICGDCLEVMKGIPDKSVDLVLTDPPYEFISKDPVGGGFMKNENKKHFVRINESFGMSFNPEKFLIEIQRICKKFSAYIFTNKELLKQYIKFAEKNKYIWDLLIWAKPNPVPIFNNHFLIDKEYIFYTREKGAIFNSTLCYKRYFTVKQYPIGTKKTTHPTEKPIIFIEDFIEISSNKNDIILDPYLGSGTTAVACKELGRRYIGIEISPEYCDMANKRLRKISERLF